MGISGLLPLLKSIQKPTQLAKFKGQTIGVDAYVWLHRGATACAIQLAMGQPTTKYVDFAMSRVRMLQHFGVVPYIVFDGDSLPSKAGTNQERRARRKEAKKLGSELLRLGKTAQAHQELQKAVEITHEMAGMFIRELKRANVKYVVAPYEADAQLAYLEKKGHISAVISEDSDLLVFGVKTLLTKLDQYGECVMVRREEFSACREVSLVFWTDEQFRQMAILSGCDYLDNIANLGLKTAHRLLRKHKTVERVLQAIRLEGKFKVPPTYLEDFKRAELTFLYQWVYCPEQRCLVNLTCVEKEVDFAQMLFIGKHVDQQTAVGVADGSLHPRSKKSVVLPDVASHSSYYASRSSQQAESENLTSKKNMTIGEFFKKRQPLAELDPNSFIMTPRQSELARRASTNTWSPSVVTSTPSFSNSTHDVTSLETQATPSTDQAQRRPSTTMAQDNVKRQRLCYDDALEMASPIIKTAMSESSKFFGPSKTTKTSGRKKRKSTGFSIFSDDSIDEALNAMPIEQIIPVSTTEPTDSRVESKQSLDNDDSQITLIDVTTPLPTSFGDDAEATFVDDDDICSPAPSSKTLLHKFIFPAPAASSQPDTVTESSKENSKTCGGIVVQEALFTTVSTAGALNTSTVVQNVRPATPKQSKAILTPEDVLVEFSKPHGSEDLLVPESESEDSDGQNSSKVLDLQRFAFSTVT